jgi:DNA-directed RNA polymerase specialized sigma24 family protein
MMQGKNRFSVDLVRSCINKEELMSSELLDILTKEIVDRETKKASEKAERLIFHVQRDSFSIPDIAKTVGVSEDEVRVLKQNACLSQERPRLI